MLDNLKLWIYQNLFNKNMHIKSKINFDKLDINMFTLLYSKCGRTLIEKIYCILNDMDTIPICKICKKTQCRFINYIEGYIDCCSKECTKQIAKIKRKNTCLKKYRHWMSSSK